MQVLIDTKERYPDYKLIPTSGNIGQKIPKRLYDEYISAAKAYNKVQAKIEKARDEEMKRHLTGETVFAGFKSCA